MKDNDKNTSIEISKSDSIIGADDQILVTGASGFIGTKVLESLLNYGFKKIRCFVRPSGKLYTLQSAITGFQRVELDFVQGNLLSREDCKRATAGVSVVYHLAAGTEKSFPGCFLNSVVTTRNILDSLMTEQTLKRFINISSLAVYSNEKIRRGGLLDESSEVDTKLVERYDPYAYGKAKQDELVLEYATTKAMPYVIVRPGVVFGPGKARIHGRVGIDTFGVFLHLGLNNRIPLTYVDNCAEAIVLAGIKKGIEGHVFNIFDDDLPRSKEFLKLYKRKVRKFFSIPVPYPAWYFFNLLWETYSKWSQGQLPPVFNRRSCAVYWKGNSYSNKKAKALLGWEPRVQMDVALDRFFTYMRKVKGQ